VLSPRATQRHPTKQVAHVVWSPKAAAQVVHQQDHACNVWRGPHGTEGSSANAATVPPTKRAVRSSCHARRSLSSRWLASTLTHRSCSLRLYSCCLRRNMEAASPLLSLPVPLGVVGDENPDDALLWPIQLPRVLGESQSTAFPCPLPAAGAHSGGRPSTVGVAVVGGSPLTLPSPRHSLAAAGAVSDATPSPPVSPAPEGPSPALTMR
jgi:hypothetical protein